MATLLARLLNRFRPREGWAPFLLTLVALLCLPVALLEISDDLGAEGLLALTALAAIIGLRFARSRLAAGATAVLGGLLGGGLVLVVVGRLLPPLTLLGTEIGRAADWVRLWRRGVMGWPPPLAATADFVWQRLGALGVRLWWWGQTVASGGVSRDPIAFVLLAATLSWAFGLFAAWQIYRRRAPLVGLLPSGAAMAVVAFFGGGMTTFYLIVYLFCLLWLAAICHLWTSRERWERTGADYPDDMGIELTLALTPPIVVLVLAAALFPVIRPRQVSDAFWRLVERPWSAVERTTERLFGPIGGGYGRGRGTGDGELPRVHLLGGSPDLDETLVMYVATDDPPPSPPDAEAGEEAASAPPPRRWRNYTLDTYTGLGWVNGPFERRAYPPGQPLDPDPPPGSTLRQYFQLVEPGGGRLYAVSPPVQVDHEVEAWQRAPGDLVQLTSNADRYTILSRPPQATEAELRAAPETLPPALADRYLALPDAVPQRVLDLAKEVAGGLETRYDRALAIQTFLRAYPYTLDLPDPPTDRDLVDYFLFERQEGYCDYYASAMVVMARAVGAPARLASGYAQGAYDYEARRWVVVEKDAHSWPEIYFEGWGWVWFEPTAALSPPDRSGGGEGPRPVVPPLPPRTGGGLRLPWMLAALGGLLLLLAATVVWFWRPHARREVTATGLVRDRYARLLRWGARLNQPFHDGQTPYEYGDGLGAALRARGRDSRWSPVRRASAEAPSEVERLTDAFVRARYSPAPITDRESWQVRDLWTRLRRRLWRLWLARLWERG